MKKILLFILIASFFAACNSSNIYKESYSFENYQWQKSNPATFKVSTHQVNIPYSIELGIRYIHGFQYTDLGMELQYTSPSGVSDSKTIIFKVRSENGEYEGSGMGDIWDLSLIADEGFIFEEKGTYTFKVVHIMENDIVGFIDEVNFKISKIEK